MDITDNSLYSYYRLKTDALGDYNAFQCGFRDHMRSEFLSDSDALASFFAERAFLRNGDVYTICMPTAVEAMVAFFALNRLGVIVNFVHPQLPPAALRELLVETSSHGIMMMDRAIGAYADVLDGLKLPVMLCSAGTYSGADKFAACREASSALGVAVSGGVTWYAEALVEGAGRTPPANVAGGDDIAILLQGGGTTGKSRTIMHTNSNVTHFLELDNDWVHAAAHPGIDTALNCMPLFHVFGLYSTALQPMCRALKTVFIPQFSAGEFIELMKLNYVTMLRGVPSMFAKLLDDPEWDGPHLRNLQHVIIGGDNFPPVLHGRIDYTLAKNGAKIKVAHGYGLTECCGGVMLNPPHGRDDETIGRPFDGLRIEIWDENHRPLPDGKIGEIAVSGPTVMYGYLSSDRKRDVGVYRDDEGRRWVLTGDLGYRNGEFFYFSGRKKRLVIISGHNAYPLDIEKVVNAMPSVRESCAVQGFDAHGKVIIRLFVAPEDGVTEGREELVESILAECARRLERFSVPREVRFIREIPKTRVGKVDFMRLTESSPGAKIMI